MKKISDFKAFLVTLLIFGLPFNLIFYVMYLK